MLRKRDYIDAVKRLLLTKQCYNCEARRKCTISDKKLYNLLNCVETFVNFIKEEHK